jgi:plasmid stability protein
LFQLAISSETPLGAALRLRASRESVSVEQVVLGILRKQLAAELDEVAGVLPLATLIQHVIQAGTRAE